MPEDKPRYLMGVGTPVNIIEAVARGVDLFDCVMPSRNARHGHLFTWQGIININNAKYELDDQSDRRSSATARSASRYSRAYIRHLLKAEEMLGMRLAVMHNLYFYNTLMEKIRARFGGRAFRAVPCQDDSAVGQKNLNGSFWKDAQNFSENACNQ